MRKPKQLHLPFFISSRYFFLFHSFASFFYGRFRCKHKQEFAQRIQSPGRIRCASAFHKLHLVDFIVLFSCSCSSLGDLTSSNFHSQRKINFVHWSKHEQQQWWCWITIFRDNKSDEWTTRLCAQAKRCERKNDDFDGEIMLLWPMRGSWATGERSRSSPGHIISQIDWRKENAQHYFIHFFPFSVAFFSFHFLHLCTSSALVSSFCAWDSMFNICLFLFHFFICRFAWNLRVKLSVKRQAKLKGKRQDVKKLKRKKGKNKMILIIYYCTHSQFYI